MGKNSIATIPSSLWIILTPNGKTLVAIYKNHEILCKAVMGVLGEPEAIRYGETGHNTLLLLFPHQNMPEELKDVAERMTSASLIDALTEGIPITDKK